MLIGVRVRNIHMCLHNIIFCNYATSSRKRWLTDTVLVDRSWQLTYAIKTENLSPCYGESTLSFIIMTKMVINSNIIINIITIVFTQELTGS